MYVCVCVSCTYIQKHFGRVYMRKMKGCIYSVEQERERDLTSKESRQTRMILFPLLSISIAMKCLY